MTTPFVDYDEKAYEQRRDAEDRRQHLKLVREMVAGGEDNAAAEAARLARDFADLTDGASLVSTDLKLPLHLRCFVDAVIGATAGSPDFVYVKDKDLAKRMGRSTKTVQACRTEFRAWIDHGALIEIKDHWRDPDTHEAHPHAYRCHLTALAVETTFDARLSPEYGKD